MRSRPPLALLASLLIVPSWLSGCDGRDVVRLDVSELLPEAGAFDASAPDVSAPEVAPDAEAPDATTQTALSPDAGDGGRPDELICAGTSAPVAIITAVLPPCVEPFPPKSSEECAAQGLRLNVAVRQCVDECLGDEQLTSSGDCCIFGVNGRCCPSGKFDEEGACLPEDPGTGLGSGVNPCGEGRHVTCTRTGSCRCVRN